MRQTLSQIGDAISARGRGTAGRPRDLGDEPDCGGGVHRGGAGGGLLHAARLGPHGRARSTAGCRATTRRPSGCWRRRSTRVLAGFVRGQVSVCLILGTFYSIALMLAGLQFGLVVGAIAGCDHLHSLCRIAGRWGAGHRPRAVPVLGRLVVDRRGGRDLRLRSVLRGQHPVAEAGGRVGRAASGVAAVCAVGFRVGLRFRGHAGGGAGDGHRSGCSRASRFGPVSATACCIAAVGRRRIRRMPEEEARL